MLFLHSRTGKSRAIPAESEPLELSPEIVWVDLLSPTQGEIATVEEASGLTLPAQAELSENPGTTPVGFVLAPELLVTVRYEPLTAFDTYEREARGSAAEIFVGLF